MYLTTSVECVSTEFLGSSMKVEIDFMSRLDVYRRRPRNWATVKGIHAIQTQWDRHERGRIQTLGPAPYSKNPLCS